MFLIGLILFFNFLWLIGVSFFIWKLQSHYNTLTEGSNGRTLQAILDNVMHDVKDARQQLTTLQKGHDALSKDSQLHIQKIGLLRFNPFKDTGGDQSFILALLNQQNTGIVISGLYSRSGTRWYAKRVVESRSVEHELSNDEKKAIEMAKS